MQNILTLSQFANDENASRKLQYFASDGYEVDIKNKRASVLDIAEQFPSLTIPFNHFLAMLPPMRVRQ